MKFLNVSIPALSGLYQVGKLYEDYSFEYSGDIQISCSLPLNETSDKEKSYNFFTGLLPEEDQLRAIARYHRLATGDTFGLLTKLGGDCAGALYFSDDENDIEQGSYRKLTLNELEEILAELPRRPFVASKKTRLSLAGAQPKLPVKYDGKDFYLPEGTAASTHILKPVYNDTLEELAENEHTCLRLGESAGLNTVKSEILDIGSFKVLLLERYDRKIVDGKVVRLHQEDFTQCLGLSKDKKYSGEYRDVAQVIRRYCKSPVLDIRSIVKWTIFNYLIGNADAHLKNISLLYDDVEKNRGLSLTPFYDIICTDIYDFDIEMAITIGEQPNPGHLTINDWKKYAEDIGVNVNIIKSAAKEIIERIDFSVMPAFKIKEAILKKYEQRKKWLLEIF